MKISIPGLEVREPLRRYPLRGALSGALVGAFLALIADASRFEVDKSAVLWGYAAGGVATGVLIGALIPVFWNRLLAGIVVGTAAAVGLRVAGHWWRQLLTVQEYVFIAAACAIMYSLLLWDYRESDEASDGRPG